MADPQSHCRIGKITRKDGCGSVRVLRPGFSKPGRNALNKFRQYSEEVSGYFADENCAGFVIVMWDCAGRFSRASHYAPGSPFGLRLAPDLVAAMLRQDTMASVTRGVLMGDD